MFLDLMIYLQEVSNFKCSKFKSIHVVYQDVRACCLCAVCLILRLIKKNRNNINKNEVARHGRDGALSARVEIMNSFVFEVNVF